MTEDQAKTKWCPMGRVAYTGGSYNRNSSGGMAFVDTKDICCIGSDCMMWRSSGFIRVDDNGKWVPMPPFFSQNKEAEDRFSSAKSQEHGYCGLAGKP